MDDEQPYIPEEYQYLLDIEITEEDLGMTTPDSP